VLVLQQRCDKPHTESKKLRAGLLHNHADKLGPFVLDGSVLFLQKSIGDMKLVCESQKTNQVFTVYITAIGEISKKQEVLFQLYNIITRKLMRNMGLVRLLSFNFLTLMRCVFFSSSPHRNRKEANGPKLLRPVSQATIRAIQL
jgi:hypothetical protein